jgi:periplasmic iron binding protein
VTKGQVARLVTAGVITLGAAVLFLNLERAVTRPGGGATPEPRDAPLPAPSPVVGVVSAPADSAAAPLRETPVGRGVERNQLRVAAAWHAAVPIAGMPAPRPGDLHLMAHIHATEGSPHGFAKGEWVPYLSIGYTIVPANGGPAVAGSLRPMTSIDGPHYGANVRLPGPGAYRLTYRIEPPPTERFTRLVDPVMGAAPWWEPFDATFEWPFVPEASRPEGTTAKGAGPAKR